MPLAIVIDDSREAANSLCEMLEFLGVTARPIYGSRAAILTIEQIVPDIVFLDIHMAGLSGFEVEAYLRRKPQTAEVPVVFVTSDDQPETESKVRKTGALNMMVKPASLEELEQILEKLNLR